MSILKQNEKPWEFNKPQDIKDVLPMKSITAKVAGQTTLAGPFQVLAKDGYKVLAVDADPDANLSMALGLPGENIIDNSTL